MPEFSANLSTMFCEHALIDRPRAAAEAGNSHAKGLPRK